MSCLYSISSFGGHHDVFCAWIVPSLQKMQAPLLCGWPFAAGGKYWPINTLVPLANERENRHPVRTGCVELSFVQFSSVAHEATEILASASGFPIFCDRGYFSVLSQPPCSQS